MNSAALRQAVNFLWRIVVWLRSTPPTIWIVIGPAVAVTAVWLLTPIRECTERDIRTLGMILQLLGFLVLAFQYDHEAKASSGKSWQAWLKSRPRYRARNSGAAAGSVDFSGKASAVFHSRAMPGPDTAIDRQIALIWQDLDSLHQRVTDEARNFRELVTLRDQEADTKFIKLGKEIAEITEALKASTLRNVRFSIFGAALFSSGIVLASWSPELASLRGAPPSCEAPLFGS